MIYNSKSNLGQVKCIKFHETAYHHNTKNAQTKRANILNYYT